MVLLFCMTIMIIQKLLITKLFSHWSISLEQCLPLDNDSFYLCYISDILSWRLKRSIWFWFCRRGAFTNFFLWKHIFETRFWIHSLHLEYSLFVNIHNLQLWVWPLMILDHCYFYSESSYACSPSSLLPDSPNLPTFIWTGINVDQLWLREC